MAFVSLALEATGTVEAMISQRYPTAALGLLLLSVSAHAQQPPPTLDALSKRVNALETRLQPERPLATWDDYGCVPNDPKVDNGPMLSRILADQQARKINVAPVGTLADYYVATPIVWPNQHGGALLGSGGYTYAVHRRDIGCTRLVWNGPAGQPMILYRAQGGRIQQLILYGAPRGESAPVAGYGILVEALGKPGHHAVPSGNLVTDQLAINRCDVGLKCINEPHTNHADQMKHFALLVDGCRVAYWTDCNQSVAHTFFSADIRSCETAFKFDRGGGLNVYGCYFAPNHTQPTLLYLGRPTHNNGHFQIQGLQVDGSARNVRLVNHGKYAFRVRVSGNVARGATVADPVVLDRKDYTGPSYSDVQIDCTHGVQWPKNDD